MLYRNIRKRYSFTTMAVCLVTCSLLTALFMLVQHWGQDQRFGNGIGGNVVARDATGPKGVHVFSKISISNHLPFVKVIVVATSALGWGDRRARIRTQFPRNMEVLARKEFKVLRMIK